MGAHGRVVAGAVGLLLIVAACGGSSATGTPGAPTAQVTAPPASEAVVASQEPAATDDSSGPEVSLAPGSAADLEAMLPDSVGGKTFAKSSFDGSSLPAAVLGFDTTELDPILTQNGKTLADVRVAVATAADQSATTPTTVLAFQVKGLDAGQLASLVGTQGDTTTTISGKQVQRFGEGTPFGGAIYLKDDVMFEILFADDAALGDILSQLP